MKPGIFPFALRRSFAAPLVALALGGLLLLTWIGALAAAPAPHGAPAGVQQDRLAGAGLVGPSQEVSVTLTPEPSPTPLPTETPLPTPTFTPEPSATPEKRILAPGDPSFNLRITKSQIPSFFKVGTGNIYILSVSRVNTNTITQTVVVEDKLPDELTWTPANIGKWDCSTSTTTVVSCFYTENNPTAFDQLRFTVNVPKDIEQTTFTNTATLRTLDADTSDNKANIITTVDSLDLQIAKTVDTTSYLTGTVSYHLVVTNTGPVVGNNVWVDETFPSDLTFTSSEPAGEFTVNSLTTGRWNIGSLSPISGQNVRRITLNFTPKSTASGKLLSNTATVKSDNFNDYVPGNNSASANVVIGSLQIGKSVSATPVQVGEPITFTFTITNPSPAAQSNVTIRDPLHRHLNIRRTPSGISGIFGTTFTLSGLTIPANSVRKYYLVVAGSSTISNTETITNAASVSWPVGGSTISVQSNTVEMIIQPGGSIQVGKTDNVTSLVAGTSISYTVSITNTGNRPVNNIVLTDTLSEYLTVVSVNPNGLGSASCPTTNLCTLTFSNALGAGAKASFQVGVKVASGTPANTTVSNHVRGVGTDDLNQVTRSNATDFDTVTAAPIYSLLLAKTVTPQQARVDESFTFRIEIANNGTNNINSLVVNDEFPDVLDLTSVTTSRGSGTLNTGSRSVTVNVGTLTPGQEARITIVAKVNSTATKIATHQNKARMTWNGGKLASNTVYFRVMPKATLPNTGWGRLLAGGGLTRLIVGLILLGGFGLALLGLAVLGYSLYLRARHPLHAGAYTRSGLFLIVLGLFAGMLGFGVNALRPADPPSEMAVLAGAKPPVATQPPAQATRTRRPTPTLNEVELSAYLPTPTPLALPDYPIPTPTGLPEAGPQGIEPDSSEVTRLVVPAMGLDTEVKFVPFDGQNWWIGGLKQEIAWMGDTSWPGLGGNTGLAGHVDLSNGDPGPFWNLKDLKPGDQVILYTQKNRYVYTVSDQTVVNDYDVGVLDQTPEAKLTMITCTGWDPDLQLYLQRLIVHASLLEVHALGE